ncbi:MAG: glycosyltransferase involved in cell wall biosynthesis [Crocinitomix sp.]|jgi:glycosyltransferase involved in cell wall biosynthesis
MRIAINTRFLLKNKMEGFGWFTYETVKRLVESHPEHDFVFFFDRAYDPKFIFSSNVKPVVLNPPARHPILFKIWFNYSVKRALKKHKIDIFFSPDGFLSLTTNTPQIGVIHDINFEHFPEDLPKSPRIYLKKYFPLFAKKAAHLITVSEFSKQDIAKTYGISLDKITVAHNGGSDAFKPVEETVKSAIQNAYTNGQPYFIFVGALHPRKNLGRLLAAFDAFKKRTNSENQLLIVGENLWKNDGFTEKLTEIEHKNAIHFSGHVDLETLTQLMASARALTFVSYFEGFGIPLVEAMKAGTPILSGNKTSLPEVTGDAGILVDPFSIEAITEGLIEIETNEKLRAELIEKGLKRGKLFNWDFTAEKIWDVIEALRIEEGL